MFGGSKDRIALIVNEFFGGANTAFGGYGFLARHYICKYLQQEGIKIDVILGRRKKGGGYSAYIIPEVFHVDSVNLYRLPRIRLFASIFLWIKNYKKYLSIEITDNYALRCEPRKKKLLFWIQDPRPASDWDEIRTVKLLQEGSYWREELYQFINKKFKEGSVTFISQGEFLKGKAKELYKLPKNLEIETLLNPIDVDSNFDVNSYEKKNIVIFLGRLENVKRAWIFFEIAKKMPELEFYVLGATKRDAEKNEKIISTYRNVRNLHFLGHVEGEMKKKFLRDAKILVNTSIHEAVPISFLEALSYGTLIVSNQNPDGLTDRFGVYVGKVLGDGFDSVDKFKKGINKILSNEVRRKEISVEAVDYIRENHSVSKIIPELIRLINKN